MTNTVKKDGELIPHRVGELGMDATVSKRMLLFRNNIMILKYKTKHHSGHMSLGKNPEVSHSGERQGALHRLVFHEDQRSIFAHYRMIFFCRY